MGKLIDLTNQKFGRLLVLSRAPNRKGKTFWLCQCDCGNQKEICGNLLKTGNTQSCGCLNKEIQRNNNINKIKGKRFGKLIALEPTEERKDRKIVWKCQCDCGNIHYVISTFLTQGRVQSCGCIASVGELKIENILKEHHIKYEKQKTFLTCKNPKTNYPLRFDFYLPEQNILIEYDGPQHYTFNNNRWYNEEYLHKSQYRDQIKNEWCIKNNITLIRISYLQYNNLTINDLVKGV